MRDAEGETQLKEQREILQKQIPISIVLTTFDSTFLSQLKQCKPLLRIQNPASYQLSL